MTSPQTKPIQRPAMRTESQRMTDVAAKVRTRTDGWPLRRAAAKSSLRSALGRLPPQRPVVRASQPGSSVNASVSASVNASVRTPTHLSCQRLKRKADAFRDTDLSIQSFDRGQRFFVRIAQGREGLQDVAFAAGLGASDGDRFCAELAFEF